MQPRQVSATNGAERLTSSLDRIVRTTRNVVALSLVAAAAAGELPEKSAAASEQLAGVPAQYVPIVQPTVPGIVEGLADQNVLKPEEAVALKAELPEIKQARIVVSWDIMNRRQERKKFNHWYASIHKQHYEPMVSPGFPNPDGAPRNVPTIKQYQVALRRFVKRYPDIKDYSAGFNEANMYLPPETAAGYYKAFAEIAPKDANLVAGDFNTNANLKDEKGKDTRGRSYVARYFYELDRLDAHPKLYGLHFDEGSLSIDEANRLIPPTTLEGASRPKMELWLTESAIHAEDPHGNETQQDAARRLLAQPAQRKYVYQLRDTDTTGRWDTALFAVNLRPRRIVRIFHQAAVAVQTHRRRYPQQRYDS